MVYLGFLALLAAASVLGWIAARWQDTVRGDLGRSLVFLGVSASLFGLFTGLYVLAVWPPHPWGS